MTLVKRNCDICDDALADTELDTEIYVPSVDVCAWCGDCYCDGIGCIADIDPNTDEGIAALDELHACIRAGKVWRQADRILARAENRR
jgi:hypothetical protein